MKMRWMKLVCSAAVAGGLAAGVSGCVSYGNTHALITPVGVAGYHTFKPANAPVRDPNRLANVKAKEEPTTDSET